MVGIYKITNPTGKIYIGQSINIENRFKHYNMLDYACIGPKLYYSLKKYGPENHIFEIVEECTIEELDKKEYLYKKHILGDRGMEDVLFLQLKDKKGGKRSKETIEKIKKSSMGKNSKIIYQFDLNGNFIKKWDSIVQAEKIYGKGIKSNLSKRTITSGGYIWSYQPDLIDSHPKIQDKWKSKTKPVTQFDMDGNIVKEWERILDIETELGFHNTNITACCKGKQKTAYGFKWKYRN
jgi:group I intron endonuclease